MATSKGKGGAGRPRNTATVEGLTLAHEAAALPVTDRETWKPKRTVKVTNPVTNRVESLEVLSDLPEKFTFTVVVGKGDQPATKAHASIVESISRLARLDGTRDLFATVSEGFTFDGVKRGNKVEGNVEAILLVFARKPKGKAPKAPAVKAPARKPKPKAPARKAPARKAPARKK